MVAAKETKALREGANVMLIIGCDFHPGFQQIAIFDNQTGAYEERRLSHRGEAEQFYRALAGQEVRGGMEACGHYPWFERLLAELRFELWLWGCGQNPGQRGAAAEDGPAGRGTSADADAGGSFSADLGAEPGGAGRAAVAGASSQASAGADPDQEPAAGAGHEPGSAEEVEVVDGGGTGGVGELGVVALRGPAPETTAAPAGRSGGGDRWAEPASGRRSERPAGGREVDDASGSGSGDRVGDGADAGTGGALPGWAQGGQLLWADPERVFQRRTAAAGTHQQAGQFVCAFSAGGSGPECGPERCRVGPLLSPAGGAQTSRAGQGGSGPQAGSEVVPDVARGLDVRATVQGRDAGKPESFCGGKLEPTA